MRCPECNYRVLKVRKWFPPKGIDPKLRRFICENPYAIHEWYMIPGKVKASPSDPTQDAPESNSKPLFTIP